LNKNLAWIKISQNELESYAELFKAIDVSNSGVLAPKELRSGFESKGEQFSLRSEDWEIVFNTMETNFEGNVGYNEFILACSKHTTSLNVKQIQELFNQIDTDGDGYLEMTEIKGN